MFLSNNLVSKCKTSKVLIMPSLASPECINYLRNLKTNEKEYFFLKWGAVVLRDCSEQGDFLTFKGVKEYKEKHQQGQNQWLLLKLQLFIDQGETYVIFQCPKCPAMIDIDALGCKQDRQGMQELRCMHSIVCQELASDWRNFWNIMDLDPNTESFHYFSSPDLKVKKLRHDEYFLCAIQTAGVISLLFTVSKRQKSPMCSQCSSPKCKCFRMYTKEKQDRQTGDHDCNRDDDWPSSEEETDHQRISHYEDDMAMDDYNHRFGYNQEFIQYPINRDPEVQSHFLERLSGKYEFPDKIIPEYKEHFSCTSHGNNYDPDDNNLVEKSQNIIVYTENGDFVFNTKVMARPSIGSCKCVQQPSGHPYLLWHLGHGKMVDYLLPYKYMHKWRSSGISMHALFQSRRQSLCSLGINSSMTYQELNKSICGFFSVIRFNDIEVFSCPACGLSPKYLVADGKADGPVKRRVDHLDELDHAEEDEEVLPQASHFKDRVFLSEISERKMVLELLTGDISADNFANSEDITSENGDLLKQLVSDINNRYPGEMPKAYARFLKNVGRATSVAGWLQCRGPEALQYLREFTNNTLDIRHRDNKDKLSCVARELPAFWPIIVRILNFENSNFLSVLIARIVQKLLDIRENTFRNAAIRVDDMYVDWPNNEEHPTQFYPGFRIFRYPKKYRVNGRTDSDFCVKAFNQKTDFSYGVFSVGCACKYNITYGFELMLNKESAHNFFRYSVINYLIIFIIIF